MPRPDVAHCKSCGKHRSIVGPLSWARLCGDCAFERLAENIAGLANLKNPALDAPDGRGRVVRQRWRRGMVTKMGGVLLDDLPRDD